ncbi:MAG: hypothetical protein HZB66_02730 [Candidatus Aenigmarchaeota archaeon]|nr:hypothetical protein [Candidatus Aenigmarchaeota archaeon]
MELPIDVTKEILVLLVVLLIALIIIVFISAVNESEAFEQSSVPEKIKEEWQAINEKKGTILMVRNPPSVSVAASSIDAGKRCMYAIETGSFEAYYPMEQSLKVIPVLYYKGMHVKPESLDVGDVRLLPYEDKAFDAAAAAKNKKIVFRNIKFTVESKKPCEKVVYTQSCARKNEQCNDYVGDMMMSQSLLFRDHIILLNIASKYPPILGPCRAQFTVECEDEYKLAWMATDSEQYPDALSIDACGASVNIDMSKAKLNCRDNNVEGLAIKIEPYEELNDHWESAGGLYLGFWSYDPKEIMKCWEYPLLQTLAEDCFEQWLGLYKINIPLERFNIR